jgi:hypothetical protein
MTLCEECEHLHSDTKRNPKYWMCVKFPRVDTQNFVTSEQRLTDPYMYCSQINGGACPLFQKRKGKQMELGNVVSE